MDIKGRLILAGVFFITPFIAMFGLDFSFKDALIIGVIAGLVMFGITSEAFKEWNREQAIKRREREERKKYLNQRTEEARAISLGEQQGIRQDQQNVEREKEFSKWVRDPAGLHKAFRPPTRKRKGKRRK